MAPVRRPLDKLGRRSDLIWIRLGSDHVTPLWHVSHTVN